MVRLPFQHFFIKNKSCTFTIYIQNSRIALQGYYLTAGNLSEKFQYSTFWFLPQFKSKNSFNNSYFNTLYRPDMTIDLGVYICTDLLQSDVRMMLCSYCYNPGQSKAELSTWSSITIGKLPPPPPNHHHHMSLNYLELFKLFNTMSTVLYDVLRDY